jgi:hypothetical protein
MAPLPQRPGSELALSWVRLVTGTSPLPRFTGLK